MPRVIVTTDHAQRDGTVLFDEQVHSVHLSTDHSARQFVERLGWAISDAESTEHAEPHQRARQHVGGVRRRRPGARNPVHA
jgi:hypothetical protein